MGEASRRAGALSEGQAATEVVNGVLGGIGASPLRRDLDAEAAAGTMNRTSGISPGASPAQLRAQQAVQQQQIEQLSLGAAVMVNDFTMFDMGPGVVRLVLSERVFPNLPTQPRFVALVPDQVLEGLYSAIAEVIARKKVAVEEMKNEANKRVQAATEPSGQARG